MRQSLFRIFAMTMIPCVFGGISTSVEDFAKKHGPSLKRAIAKREDWLTTPNSKTGNTHLHQLILEKSYDDAICMIEAELGVNVGNKEEETPIFLAIRQKALNVVQALIANNAVLNMCNVKRSSPLDVAVETGHEEIMMALLQDGADLHWKPTEGSSRMIGRMSPLMRSVVHNQVGIARILLDKEVNVEFQGYCGETSSVEYEDMSPLAAAVYKIHEEMVTLLLDNDADANYRDAKGSGLLHLVVQRNEKRESGLTKTRIPNAKLSKKQKESLERIVNKVVAKGARPTNTDVANVKGTPLNYSIVKKDEVAFDIFVKRILAELHDRKKGPWMSSLSAKNYRRENPLQAAKEYGSTKMERKMASLYSACKPFLLREMLQEVAVPPPMPRQFEGIPRRTLMQQEHEEICIAASAPLFPDEIYLEEDSTYLQPAENEASTSQKPAENEASTSQPNRKINTMDEYDGPYLNEISSSSEEE